MRRKRSFCPFPCHSACIRSLRLTSRCGHTFRNARSAVLYFPLPSVILFSFSFFLFSLFLSLFVFGLCVRVKLVKTTTQTLHYSSSCPTCYGAASRAITHKRVKKEGSLSLFLSPSILLFPSLFLSFSLAISLPRLSAPTPFIFVICSTYGVPFASACEGPYVERCN